MTATKTTHVLTDGSEVHEVRAMTDGEYAMAEEHTRNATGGNWLWRPIANLTDDELKAAQELAWDNFQKLEPEYEALRDRWAAFYRETERRQLHARVRAELEAKIRAELAADYHPISSAVS